MFKFKLDSILKLRKLEEEKVRQELGIILQKMNLINKQIAFDQNAIDQYYLTQQKVLVDPVFASKIAFFPQMIEGKKQNLRLLYREKVAQQKLIEKKQQELNEKRAKLKAMEKLRLKDFEKYKIEKFRKDESVREEQVQLWLNHQKVSGES